MTELVPGLRDWRVTLDEEGIAWAIFDREGETANALGRRPTNALFVRYTATRESAAAMHQLMTQLDPLLSDIVKEVGLE